MPGEAVFPLRGRQDRNARRPAADPPGLRGLPALRLPLPGNDNLNDAGRETPGPESFPSQEGRMSQVITKRFRVSRRRFLQGLTLTGSAVQVGLPPLVSMFNSTGTAYAAEGVRRNPSRAASSSGSMATASPSGIGFPARPVPIITSRRASVRWRRSATISTFSAAWTTRRPIPPAPATATTRPSAASPPVRRSPATARAEHPSTRPSPPESAAIRASARSRSASRRNRSARASSAT